MRNQAVAKSGFSLSTLLLMVPVIAGLSNPGMVSSAVNMLPDGVQSAVSSFSPDIDVSGTVQSFASNIAAHTGSLGGAHYSSPVYISGSPIFLN